MTEPSRLNLSAAVRTMQLIAAAITVGPVIFLIIVVVLRSGRAPIDGTPTITYVAVAFTVAMLLGRMFIPRAVVDRARQALVRDRRQAGSALGEVSPRFALAQAFQTQLIISAAQVEASAFFLIVAYLLEGTLLSVILSMLLIVGLALHIPTESRVERWIEQQEEQLSDELRHGS